MILLAIGFASVIAYYFGPLSQSILPAIAAAFFYVFGSLVYGLLSKGTAKSALFGFVLTLPFLYVFRNSSVFFLAFAIPFVQAAIGYYSSKNESDLDVKGFYYLALVFLMILLVFMTPLIYFPLTNLKKS
ncbi:hypothetical protein [Methanolapillus ohkumae]|uniref:hypothetical protein n=1 Tax=Methanolapillus ohkumae TaxID=3028298 RepID=UPI0030B8BC38